MSKNKANPIIVKRGMSIGTGNAETDDDFLFSCFVDHWAIAEYENVRSPKMVVSGRTGSGKTAVLRMIQERSDNSSSVELEDMSMSYVANSDILRFLDELGADLDVLFQVLWKHVLCIEFIRLRWSVHDAKKSLGIFDRIIGFFERDDRKTKALNYLESWKDRFWITMDENVREITEKYERELQAELGAELGKFKAGGQYVKRMSTEKKKEIVARVRSIIDGRQLNDLAQVIDALGIVSKADKKHVCYLMVDQLDENWVDVSIRFKLIRALLNSLRQFRKIEDLKILVALRTDVRERTLLEAPDPTFQREKLDDYSLDLKWTKLELYELIQKRIQELFKRQYSGSIISFEDIFPAKVGIRPTFDWMLERTLMRPRDIINFVNTALTQCSDRSEISQANLRKSYLTYSARRRDALIQEWSSTFPYLRDMIELFLDGTRKSVYLHEISEQKIDDFILKVVSHSDIIDNVLSLKCKVFVDGKGGNSFDILANAASTCYRTGCIGIKLSQEHPFNYSHLDEPLLDPAILTPSSRVRLQPMLFGAYRIEE